MKILLFILEVILILGIIIPIEVIAADVPDKEESKLKKYLPYLYAPAKLLEWFLNVTRQ